MGKVFFKNSPVIEVVVGIQFSDFIFSYSDIYGLYSNLFKLDFPKITENKPLPSIIEKYNVDTEVKIPNGFQSRKFFISENDEKLIQIQPDRILFNWRKSKTGGDYPHFETVFNQFLELLEKIRALNFKIDDVSQYEVTYIDHIDKDEIGLNEFRLDKIFNYLQIGAPLKNIDLKYAIPNENINGNLTVSLQSAIRRIDQKKLFVYETTCRGFDESKNIHEWFEQAHTILVDYFVDSISDLAKESWGMKTI